jgi:hypothetical protein
MRVACGCAGGRVANVHYALFSAGCGKFEMRDFAGGVAIFDRNDQAGCIIMIVGSGAVDDSAGNSMAIRGE